MRQVDAQDILTTLIEMCEMATDNGLSSGRELDVLEISAAFTELCAHPIVGADQLTIETAGRASAIIDAAAKGHGLPVIVRRACSTEANNTQEGIEDRTQSVVPEPLTPKNRGHDAPVLDLAVTLGVGLALAAELPEGSFRPDKELWKATVFSWACEVLATDLDSLVDILNRTRKDSLSPRWSIDFGTKADLLNLMPPDSHALFPNKAQLDLATNSAGIFAACLLLAEPNTKLPSLAQIAGALAYQGVLQDFAGTNQATQILSANPLAVFCWTAHNLARLILPQWNPHLTGNLIASGSSEVQVVLSMRRRLGVIDFRFETNDVGVGTGGSVAESDRAALIQAVELGLRLIVGHHVTVNCDSKQHDVAEKLVAAFGQGIRTIQWTDIIGDKSDLVDEEWRTVLQLLPNKSDPKEAFAKVMAGMRKEIQKKKIELISSPGQKENRSAEVRRDLRMRLKYLLERV